MKLIFSRIRVDAAGEWPVAADALVLDLVLLEFLAQGAAIDAQAACRPGLVVIAVAHDGCQQGFFDLDHHFFIQVFRLLAIQVIKILVQCGGN